MTYFCEAVEAQHKTCTKCGVFKPVSCFYERKTDPTGLRTDCKDCVRASVAARRPERKSPPLPPPVGERACIKCGVTKPPEGFREKRNVCLDCRNARNRQLFAENPEKYRAREVNRPARDQEQVRAYRKRRWAENKDRLKAESKAWREANPDRVKANNKAWYAANKEYSNAKSREYREANRDHVLAKSRENGRKHYAANRDSIRAKHAEYHAANPGKTQARVRKRRAIKLQNGVVPYNFQDVGDQRSWRCCDCGSDLRTATTKERHVGHLVPLARGGQDAPHNVAPQCAKCNLRQFTKLWAPLRVLETLPGLTLIAPSFELGGYWFHDRSRPRIENYAQVEHKP